MSGPFKLEQAYEAGRQWRKHFPGIPLHDVYDKELSALFMEVKIDLAAFDGYLSMAYPEESGMLSMEETVTKHYGVAACDFMKRLL